MKLSVTVFLLIGVTMKNTFIGSLSVILAAVIWGCVGIVTRALYSYGLGAVDITFVRAMLTVIFMFVFLVIFRRDLLKIKLKHIPIFIGSGIASFLFFNYCYMSSINENSLSVACILMYTSPIWVTIISAFAFKERITAKKIAALVLALGGCALVSFQGETKITTLGLVYGILSGIGYALYTIFGRIGVKYYSSITVTFYTFVFATIGGLPFVVTGKLPSLILQPDCFGWCVAAAVFSTIIPYLLYTFGLTKIQSSTASIISIVEPIMATVVGFFAFHENLTAWSFTGIVVVVFALILLEIPLKRKPKEAKNEA